MMWARLTIALIGSVSALVSTSVNAQPGETRMPAPIVFFDIAGPADAHQAAFYESIFGWKAGPGGTLSVPIQSSMLRGALRADPAAKVIYIGVTDLSSTLKDIAAAGGKIVMPRFEVKGVAVIGLFHDPAGNTMGLVELTSDGKSKVP